MIRIRSPFRFLLSAALVVGWGCTAPEPAPSAASLEERPEAGSPDAPSRTIQISQRDISPSRALNDVQFELTPWEFAGIAGQVIRTRNYEVYTTIRRQEFLDQLPVFLERSMRNYTTALGELPLPDKPLQTYLLATRSEWEAKTKQVLSDQADAYLKLGRGGFTTRGMAILYDIDRRGWRDTLSIAAHEGWHQYTQQTFANTMPVWLEEGVATYMEGHTNTGGPPEFRPWANYERYGALRRAVRNDQLIPLSHLLRRTPQSFLASGKDELLNYYAQVWALVHFMVSGEDGRYAAALQDVLQDAASGRLAPRIYRSEVAWRGHRRPSGFNLGPAVVLEYFNPDLNEFQAQYEQFVRDVGSQPREAFGRIRQGLDPRRDR